MVVRAREVGYVSRSIVHLILLSDDRLKKSRGFGCMTVRYHESDGRAYRIRLNPRDCDLGPLLLYSPKKSHCLLFCKTTPLCGLVKAGSRERRVHTWTREKSKNKDRKESIGIMELLRKIFWKCFKKRKEDCNVKLKSWGNFCWFLNFEKSIGESYALHNVCGNIIWLLRCRFWLSI